MFYSFCSVCVIYTSGSPTGPQGLSGGFLFCVFLCAASWTKSVQSMAVPENRFENWFMQCIRPVSLLLTLSGLLLREGGMGGGAGIKRCELMSLQRPPRSGHCTYKPVTAKRLREVCGFPHVCVCDLPGRNKGVAVLLKFLHLYSLTGCRESNNGFRTSSVTAIKLNTNT